MHSSEIGTGGCCDLGFGESSVCGCVCMHVCVGGDMCVHVCSTWSSRVTCGVCNRSFRRQADLKRHRCREDRMKPILLQKGAIQCKECDQCFRSRGGLAVHKSRPVPTQL